jgi:hypothetical protein
MTDRSTKGFKRPVQQALLVVQAAHSQANVQSLGLCGAAVLSLQFLPFLFRIVLLACHFSTVS